MQKEKFEIKDYVVCVNNEDIEGLSIGKIYIVYGYYNNYGEEYFKIKNDNYIKEPHLRGLYTHRFRKATEKEIVDNIADITMRKCKNAI